MSESVELLFFDTFAHDNSEEINLDLVQFPKPVYVVEVRIIPLGARVQADFPGGVRLGATNPSQFDIEFFVNDLGKTGASTFETLGGFKYDQNGCINLDCVPNDTVRKIPTDGLVLRGWYTTITLAVYGTLTKNIAEQIIQPVVNPSLTNQTNVIQDNQQICSGSPLDTEWPQDAVPIDYTAQQTTPYQQFTQPEQYVQDFDYYPDVPKDPRSYHHTPETEWDNKTRREGDRDHSRDRSEIDRKRYTRSESKDRQLRDYRETEREQEVNWQEHEPDYRIERTEVEWNDRERIHERDRQYKHDDNYRRSYNRNEDREDRKRPRTPPNHSPKRPHTPHVQEHTENQVEEPANPQQEDIEINEANEDVKVSPVKETPVEEPPQLDVEEFEPILSDEDILDDPDHYQDMEFDYTAYTNTDDLIKLFVPGVNELIRYPKKRNFLVNNNSIDVEENFKTIISIADDYFKSSITKYDKDVFKDLNTEIKEEFVHLCEKVINNIGSYQIYGDIVKLYVETIHIRSDDLSKEDKELVEQVRGVVTTITDWLKISIDYELANLQKQPTYKIRHLKSGVRLADYCCTSRDFVELLLGSNFNVHHQLINLYEQEFMALSIKLMILKALDTYLHHELAIEKFLWDDSLLGKKSIGYVKLIGYIRSNPLVRLKFALISIIRKLNLYEMLRELHATVIKFRDITYEISTTELNLITKSLNRILGYVNTGPFVLSQPKRFLPVASQFDIIKDNNDNILINYFKMFDLLEIFLLLLTHSTTMNLPLIKTPIYEVLSIFLTRSDSLKYLYDNIETTNVLVKFFIKNLDDYDNIDQKLGLKISYKLRGLYHIDSLLDKGKQLNFDWDQPEIIDNLHGLFCLTFQPVGKITCAELLGMDDNILCLLQFFDYIFSKDKPEMILNRIKTTPSVGYIIDLIYIAVTVVSNVPLLEKHSKLLLHLCNYNMLFDDNENNKITELKYYLLPFENIIYLSYDNISIFVETIVKHMENFPHNLGPIITSLRIIEHLGIRPYDELYENYLSDYVELKYKHVILQLFSLDGTSIITKFLQKICDYYEQPSLHSSIIAANQGWIIVNSIRPSVILLKQMLSYVIQCQNTNFKDLTAIPILLRTYDLLNNFPVSSAVYFDAQRVKIKIVDTLLVYTQPVSERVNEKDSLSKTLWTKMCGEVIKYITSLPHTFVSGLLIFSELLPLPLPLQTIEDISDDEISWIMNLRKLWSAHLHPHTTIIQDTVNILCISTQTQLLNLLRRICVQIADLAANSAVMIARGVLDNVYDAVVPKENAKISPCNSHIARLLNFLACLVTQNTIKCAVLHLLHSNSTVTSKTEERYVNLIPAFGEILKIINTSNSHVQAQECILSILQSFCDTEITLTQTGSTSKDGYLANSMPTKEHLLMYINMMGEHLINENSFVTYLPIVRTLLLLTEHDYGFLHLKDNLLKKNDLFLPVLNKLADNFSKDNRECLSTLNTSVEFLRVCVNVEEESDGNLPYSPRKIKLSSEELRNIVGWRSGEDNEQHPLKKCEKILKETVEENKTYESFLEGLTALLKLLQDGVDANKESNPIVETNLPAPESLLVQFSKRLVFSSSDACDERLTSTYWLGLPTDEGENDSEHVNCDLIEVCRQNLRPDFNIIKEIEKLCRISRNDNLDDKKRMEDVNLKLKKPFVTPMRARGFARSVPQRPDLFRSRPPNTSRPPSLHVDDFVALETCGAQPTGPTGYNKLSREVLASTRIARGTRGRAFVTSERSMQYRQMPWWGAGLGRGPY
ncbi:protein virilizer isoform X1 [Diorhabda sublineata]|uniref:protein virilizer isoform X1 n=1 Tax=Diorhabda sublineata TaxID=1163346 RepID=UPI0024E09150|nr:protein virilizer isoform X1 [Diorhabda sublineata]